MMIRYYARATGRVQGVGFRYFVCGLAKRYGLTGWVRNCADGSVDMEVQGPKPQVEAFFLNVEAGDRWIRVDSLKQEEQPCREEDRFGVMF